MTISGIAWAPTYTIASEIGEIEGFASPTKLTGNTGLCPKVYQSGATDHRGGLVNAGPEHLRWALIEPAVHAARYLAHTARGEAAKKRLGRHGAKVTRASMAPARSPKRSGRWSPAPRGVLRQVPCALWSHRRPSTEMDHLSEFPSDLILPTRRRHRHGHDSTMSAGAYGTGP